MILADKITDLRKRMDGHRKNWQTSWVYLVKQFRNGKVRHLYQIWIR